MENEKTPDSETVAFRLKHRLGTYAARFADHVTDGHPPYDEHLEEILTEEWDGAVPEPLVPTAEEVSRSIMGILFTMLDFAIEEAKKRKDYDGRDEGILHYHVEPCYDDVSTMLVTHRETETVLLNLRRKTYRFDPETIDHVLEKMVEEISEGIDLVRKRLRQKQNRSGGPTP